MSTLIVLIIAIYLASAILCWLYLHLAYSKMGIWSISPPELFDIVLTFLPIGNTIYASVCWLSEFPVEKDYSYMSRFLKRFYRIKR